VSRILLIANPGSGDGGAERAGDLMRDLGADVETLPIERAAEAGEAGAGRVAVAGGDGSIGAAAAAASAAGVPLAVLACGTANDFAAAHGLPTVLDEACRLAIEGTELRHLELASVGGRTFVNVVSAGLAPAAAEGAAALKERLGPLAYPAGAVEAGISGDPIECTVGADGEDLFTGAAWQISVASSGAFGGGASLLADGSDGMLDVTVIERSSRARLVKVAYGLTVGTVENQSGVVSARAAEISLGLDREEKLNVDGELLPVADLADADGLVRLRAERPGFDLVVG
jgi:diacylglycerol kinase (ATP)